MSRSLIYTIVLYSIQMYWFLHNHENVISLLHSLTLGSYFSQVYILASLINFSQVSLDRYPTYYNLKNNTLKKIAMNSIIERLDFKNTHVRKLLHVWKTR